MNDELFTPEDLQQLFERHGHRDISTLTHIQGMKSKSYLQEKFLSHDEANIMNDVAIHEAHIVTGFGPTNAPTGGTLSVILKAISLWRETGIEMTIVISNLGAYCSRTTPPPELRYYTERFLGFLEALGLGCSGAMLRTHEDFNVLRIAGLLTRVLTDGDLEQNKEATTELYGRMGLLGNRLGIYVDTLYTVADILEPLICHGKKRVLVLAGIEEHYFTDLARLAIKRFNERYRGQFLDVESGVGGLYARLIGGLYPYPKMSKSMPDSAININDPDDVLVAKIVHAPPENDRVLFQMMTLVSDWSTTELAEVRRAYAERQEHPSLWQACKEKYIEFFRGLQAIWTEAGGREMVGFQSLLPKD